MISMMRPMMGEVRSDCGRGLAGLVGWWHFDGNGTGSFVRFVFMLVTSGDGGRKKSTKERHWISIVRNVRPWTISEQLWRVRGECSGDVMQLSSGIRAQATGSLGQPGVEDLGGYGALLYQDALVQVQKARARLQALLYMPSLPTLGGCLGTLGRHQSTMLGLDNVDIYNLLQPHETCNDREEPSLQ